MTAYDTSRSADRDRDDVRRANPMGAYITTVGALITLLSVWLNWVTLSEGESEEIAASGYEADGVIPFMGYLGVAFAVALLYAVGKADRRQHRGLSLASMAVGLASLVWALSFLVDPIATVELGQNVSTEIGVYIAILGTAIWTVGSYLLAKEPEGDVERAREIQHHHADTNVHDTHHTDTSGDVAHRRDNLAHNSPDYDERHGIETHGTDASRHTPTDR